MDQIDEVKQWIQFELWPSVVKSGKLKPGSSPSQISNETSFKLVDICVRPIGRHDVYMLTNCYKVKVVYVYGEAEDTCFFMAKKTLKVSTENYEAINFDSLFFNEILGYTKIIPTLQRFAGPKLNDIAFPTYYYSKLLTNEASIVLGDFESNGWRMSKERINLSLDHVLLAIEQIAVFHGLSYALKATERDNFDALTVLLKESRFARAPPPQWITVFSTSVLRLKRAADKFSPQVPSHFLNKLEKLLSNNFIYAKRRVQPVEPYATLCHGDFLRNNVAYQYSNQDPDRPTAAMMFDFQTLRYASPMVDVCVFLSLSTGKDIRPMHFDAIFDAYHRKLTSTFADHSASGVPAFLSKSELLKEYVRYLPYGLWIASFFLSFLHVPDGMTPEDMVAPDTTEDMLLREMMARGGDAVDAEVAAIVKELYDLTVREKVDIFENFI